MQVIQKLKKGGGKRDTYLCEMVTHVIADDITNHEYQEARELFELPCVMVGTCRPPDISKVLDFFSFILTTLVNVYVDIGVNTIRKTCHMPKGL